MYDGPIITDIFPQNIWDKLKYDKGTMEEEVKEVLPWAKHIFEDYPTITEKYLPHTVLKHEEINVSNKEFFETVLKRLTVLEEKYALLKDLIEQR